MATAYFAYGANMAAGVMASHCPTHRMLGIAELRDYQLAFRRRSVRTGTGVADVMPQAGHRVWGVLYELDDDDFAALDAKEGAGWAYDRCTVAVWLPSVNEQLAAVTYRVREPEPAEVTPSNAYAAGLISAARERGLPRSYVRELEGAVARTSAQRRAQT
jgi:gamma-glutamylcyclotransferase